VKPKAQTRADEAQQYAIEAQQYEPMKHNNMSQ
jgi:hypothetical protein